VNSGSNTVLCGRSIEEPCKSIVFGCKRSSASLVEVSNGEYAETERFTVFSVLVIHGENNLNTLLTTDPNSLKVLFYLSSSTSNLAVKEMKILFRNNDIGVMFAYVRPSSLGCILNFSRCYFTQHSSVQNIVGEEVIVTDNTSSIGGSFLCENSKMSNVSSFVTSFDLRYLSSALLFNCSFINNYCVINNSYTDYPFGGCIYCYKCTLINVSRCLFQNCYTYDRGGGIYIRYSIVYIENSLFIGLLSNCTAGSLWFDYSPITINNCSFLHSYANANGGAVMFAFCESVSIEVVNFYNCCSSNTYSICYLRSLANIIGSGGGAFFWNSNQINISLCSFVNCFTSNYGMNKRKKMIFFFFLLLLLIV
jgi:hypothetical protein